MIPEKIKAVLLKYRLTASIYRSLAQRLSPFQKKKRAFQKYGEESFRNTIIILNEAGIEYFPAFGTLLGIVRDGCLIPHDFDIDFGVITAGKEYDWSRLINVLGHAGFHILRWFEFNGIIHEMTFSPPMSSHVNIDFFTFFQHDDRLVTHTCYRLKEREYSSKQEFTLIEEVFPMIDGFRNEEHLNVTIPIPSNAEEILETSYTSAWRIPDPEWRDEYKPNRKEAEGVLAFIHKQKTGCFRFIRSKKHLAGQDQILKNSH